MIPTRPGDQLVGNTIVYDHDAFDWSGDDAQHPALQRHGDLRGPRRFVQRRATRTRFASVAIKLGHLQKLGVHVLQLMPVANSQAIAAGYNPAHIRRRVRLRRPRRLKIWSRAHSMGIAMFMDVVYNHFGRVSTCGSSTAGQNDKGGIYFYNDERFNTPVTRPDYGRGEVRQFIFDNAQMCCATITGRSALRHDRLHPQRRRHRLGPDSG